MKQYTREFAKLMKVAAEDKEIEKLIKLYERQLISIFDLVNSVNDYYSKNPDRRNLYYEK